MHPNFPPWTDEKTGIVTRYALKRLFYPHGSVHCRRFMYRLNARADKGQPTCRWLRHHVTRPVSLSAPGHL